MKNIKRILLNLPGFHTNRKIIVIESDDWGAVRMPSKEVFEKFISKGISVDKDPYCKYDSLATPADFEALFEVLSSFKDKNGRNAVITANTIVANPDFKKIKQKNFEEYHFEPFTETLKQNQSTENSFKLWQQGIAEGLFKPQFHGREHLYVKKWMKSLQKPDKLTHLAFEYGTYGLTSAVHEDIITDFMGAYNSGLASDTLYFKEIITEGLDLFEDIFKYKSESFIPTTYTWHPDIEEGLIKRNVKFLQGMVHQKIPLDDDKNFIYKKNNFLGRKSKMGLTYLTRNVFFEPSQNPNFNWVNDAMQRISIAFLMRSPVIISIHRLNFIGSIFESNRKKGLELLGILLTKILQKFPDVEFMSSDELGNHILSKSSEH
jgi:hypothetical protein